MRIRYNQTSTATYQTGYNMISPITRYDYTVFSIPQSSADIHPRYTKLIRSHSLPALSMEYIYSVQLKYISGRYAENHSRVVLAECSAWKFISRQINNLNREYEIIRFFEDIKSSLIIKTIQSSYATVQANEVIAVSNANCNNTPWSAFPDKSRLYFFTWELDDKSIPLLFDYFHIILQTEILSCKGADYSSVNSLMNKLMATAQVKNIVDKFGINILLHYKVYLLFAMSYYLRFYIENQYPKQIINRFINIWHQALSELK